MVIFLNKIIFLPQVKDSSLPTNLCQENPSRCGPMSAAAERLALSWGQRGGTGGSQAARPPSTEEPTCGRLICMIITIMDPLWCQPPHLTESSITLIAAGKPEQGLKHSLQSPDDVKRCEERAALWSSPGRGTWNHKEAWSNFKIW